MSQIKYSLELERRVLITLMHLSNHNDLRVQKAILALSRDCFYCPYHQLIFIIIYSLFNEKKQFDFVSVLVLISKNHKEAHDTMAEIMNDYSQFYVTSTIFETDVDHVITLNILRKQLEIAEEMIHDVKEIADPDIAQECLMKNINLISNLNFKQSQDGIDNMELAESYYDGNLPKDLIIPTTSNLFNKALNGGIRAKSLITIAAGAGVGKTGFAIWLMDVIARNQPDHQSLFFSLEMESKHIWMRHCGICAGIQFDKMNEEQRIAAVTKSLMVPFKIYDPSRTRMAADIDFIITTSRLKAIEKPISVIVVDYLGLVQNRGTFERNDLKQSDITNKLAALAMELNCVVIALSQINRGNIARTKEDRCPYPEDASNSSGSYHSSTLWIGVDRPELYQQDPSYSNQFVIKCRKNRFGQSFEMILAFNEGTFSEVNIGHFSKPHFQHRTAESYLFSKSG